MQFIIVTGMSGAGKTMAIKFFEDLGYFCVDNLPPSLIPKFAEICFRAGSGIDKVALGIDIRGGRLLEDLLPVLSFVPPQDETGFTSKILFLDASDETLVKRYKETRHVHPLARNERIEIGIEKERGLLKEIKDRADYIIDTTHLLTRQLKEKINDIFLDNKEFDSLIISVLSFGFKYGIPSDSDLVFDVRFLPNPFYVSEMKELTGEDAPVRDYVLSHGVSNLFMDKLNDMLEFLIPNYINEGKNQLVISVGCTGGKHRSVTLANVLYNHLKGKGHSVLITHRDIKK